MPLFPGKRESSERKTGPMSLLNRLFLRFLISQEQRLDFRILNTPWGTQGLAGSLAAFAFASLSRSRSLWHDSCSRYALVQAWRDSNSPWRRGLA